MNSIRSGRMTACAPGGRKVETNRLVPDQPSLFDEPA